MDTLSLTLGEPGATQPTPQELDERVAVLEDRVKREAREIVESLRLDFPRFLERVIKDRFLGAGEFGDKLGDAQLRAIKAEVAEAGRRAVAEILPTLEDWPIWVNGAGQPPSASERRDLSANAEVHARIQKVGGYVKEILEKHKFPNIAEEDFREAYRIPTFFIGGRQPLKLVENYWRDIEDLQRTREELRLLRDQSQRTQRSERWNSV